MRTIWAGLALTALCAIGALMLLPNPRLARAHPMPAQEPVHTQPKPKLPNQSNPLVAPLFIQDDRLSSFVSMVNEAKADLTAELVVHSPQGDEVARQTFTLVGHSATVVQVKDLLGPRASDVHFGSIMLIPQPSQGMMPIAAQLSMVGQSGDHPRYLDSEFMMAGGMMASQPGMAMNQLRGVASGAVGAPTVALTNVSSVAQSVTVSCVTESHAQAPAEVFVVPAMGTKLVQVCGEAERAGSATDAEKSEAGRAVGISLEYKGTPGDIAAFGYGRFAGTPAMASIEFQDPSILKSHGTVWTGISLGPTEHLSSGSFQVRLALSNFSNAAVTAKLLLLTTSESGSASEQASMLELAPLSAKTIEVAGAAGSPGMRNSFVLTASGQADDVVSSLLAYNKSAGQLVQTVTKDLGQSESGGGHPWAIADGVDSTLLLFNPTSDPVVFNVKIPAGVKMWGKGYTLAPGSTLNLDLGKLVANEATDDSGFKLPTDMTGGELSWFNPDPHQGFGRIVQTNPDRLLARNFSCGYNMVLCGSYLDVSVLNLYTGGTGFLGGRGAILPGLLTQCVHGAVLFVGRKRL